MGFDGFWWVLMGSDGLWWVLMGSDGFWWVLMGFDGFWWALMENAVVSCRGKSVTDSVVIFLNDARFWRSINKSSTITVEIIKNCFQQSNTIGNSRQRTAGLEKRARLEIFRIGPHTVAYEHTSSFTHRHVRKKEKEKKAEEKTQQL